MLMRQYDDTHLCKTFFFDRVNKYIDQKEETVGHTRKADKTPKPKQTTDYKGNLATDY